MYKKGHKKRTLFQFYVENREPFIPQLYPPLQLCLIFISQNKYFRNMVYYFY